MPYTLNGHPVDLVVTLLDGARMDPPLLTPLEQAAFEAADTALSGHAEFKVQYPGATLMHIESNRGVADNRHGRFYLRYALEGKLPLEFFAFLAPKVTVDLEKGLVGVVLFRSPVPGP